MQIELKEIPIREVFDGYSNSNEEGVIAFGGHLNIRPKYQREFIYKDKQRDAVIDTIRNSFPLNVMYWIENEDGIYEVLDGQQRTVSFCEYLAGNFSLNYQYFHNLTEDKQNQILDYKLMIYVCSGTDSERLKWFETINIAGEKLTKQELLNATYTGEWLTDAKRHFSKTGCVAWNLGKDYLKGAPIRQDYLEKVILWISNGNNKEYMAEHQHDTNARELWLYFQNIITWINTTFTEYRREMKGTDWGILYNEFKDLECDPKEIEEQIKKLMIDDDVTKKAGIYPFILTNNPKYLNIRAFTDNQKRETYERQEGVCLSCKEQFNIKDMEADHITPWSEGGKTNTNNCQMLCKHCNRTKGSR
jgi:hypothetical protein